MSIKSKRDFLALLEEEALYQSQLQQQRLLPKQLDGLARLVGQYPWQVLSLSALLSAAAAQYFK